MIFISTIFMAFCAWLYCFNVLGLHTAWFLYLCIAVIVAMNVTGGAVGLYAYMKARQKGKVDENNKQYAHKEDRHTANADLTNKQAVAALLRFQRKSEDDVPPAFKSLDGKYVNGEQQQSSDVSVQNNEQSQSNIKPNKYYNLQTE